MRYSIGLLNQVSTKTGEDQSESIRAAKTINIILVLLNRLTIAAIMLSLLVITNWMATMAILVMGLIFFMLLYTITQRYSLKVGRERIRLDQEITAEVTESIATIKEIRLFALEERQLSRLDQETKKFRLLNMEFDFISNIPGQAIELSIIVLLSITFTYIHLTEQFTLQEVIPLLGLFLVFSQRITVHISSVITQRMKIISFLPSLRMMFDLGSNKNRQVPEAGKITMDGLTNDIVLKNISFTYDKEKSLLTNLNLRIAHGKTTAIVGSSGSGKSTIADLVVGLFEPQKGGVYINDHDLRSVDLNSWRSRIGYVGQDGVVFNCTLAENIKIGNPDANHEDVVAAAKAAYLHDFILSTPQGYDTIVGDRGVKLSGGQRQRIAIARAIIRRPDFFVFDEATSALDLDSERIVQENIERLSSNKTTLIIAHRLDTIKNADFIYRIEPDGSIDKVSYDNLIESKV
jgi:ABC-type multidrug transport system fused ATPase/permease subunit